MAADVNNVTMGGRLTRDAEIRHSGSGQAIVNIRLACSSRQRDESGNWGDKSNYFDVVFFPRGEGGVVPFLVKGKAIVFTGRASWREWRAQDGSSRQAVEFVAQDIYLQGGGDDRRLETGGAQGAPVDELAPAPAPERAKPSADDDIPF